jgi:hypothetical protein
MESGIFSAARLDDPNQIETVRQIPLLAQRDLAGLRAPGEAAQAAISPICRPSGKSLGLPPQLLIRMDSGRLLMTSICADLVCPDLVCADLYVARTWFARISASRVRRANSFLSD